MVVLVPGKRQAVALGGVADQAGRPVVPDAVEGIEQHAQIVAREVGHQRVQRRIVAPLDQGARRRLAREILRQPLAPARPALEGERGVERVRAGVDPVLQRRPAGLGEGGLQQAAVFQRQHPPADRAEQLVDAPEQPVRDHRIEALAVVVDDPPEIAHVVLPALQQGLEDIALVELGIAHERDHPPLPALEQPAAGEIVLRQRGEHGLRRAEPDRAGREVDVVVVLAARGVGLGAAEAAEALQPVAALAPQQILDGVEHRRRVRLDRNPVLRPQHVEIERRHDRRQRGAGRLVPAHLEPVARGAQVVRVVDRPGGEPQHLALQRGQDGAPVGFGPQDPRGQARHGSLPGGGRQYSPGRFELSCEDARGRRGLRNEGRHMAQSETDPAKLGARHDRPPFPHRHFDRSAAERRNLVPTSGRFLHSAAPSGRLRSK